MLRHSYLKLALLVCVLPTTAMAAASDAPQQQQIQRGKYLVKIAGCNDCHTSGYAMSGGKVAEAQWLTGDKLGWRGPWGTTYPSNLRLYFATTSETQWVKRAKTAVAKGAKTITSAGTISAYMVPVHSSFTISM